MKQKRIIWSICWRAAVIAILISMLLCNACLASDKSIMDQIDSILQQNGKELKRVTDNPTKGYDTIGFIEDDYAWMFSQQPLYDDVIIFSLNVTLGEDLDEEKALRMINSLNYADAMLDSQPMLTWFIDFSEEVKTLYGVTTMKWNDTVSLLELRDFVVTLVTYADNMLESHDILKRGFFQ